MSVPFVTWPFFRRESQISEAERWWSECHLPEKVESALSSQTQWMIVIGGIGSGKSVFLNALSRRARERALILMYPAEYWPGGTKALGDGNHLSQIMAQASYAIRSHLTNAPDKLMALTVWQRQFLCWLVQKFADHPRAYGLWLERLGKHYYSLLPDISQEKFYETDTETRDVRAQIEELLHLIQGLGYQEILILIDVDIRLADDQLEQLGELFEMRDLMHYSDLTVVAALPKGALQKVDLIAQAGDRANPVYLIWSLQEVRLLADRHVTAATGGHITSLDQLATPQLLDNCAKLIDTEYAEPSPRGWIDLAQLLLHLAAEDGTLLNQQQYDTLVREYFMRFMRLRLPSTAPPYEVWRGPKLINLKEKPFLFLELLWRRKGRLVTEQDLRNVGLSGKKGYIHTLAMRVRNTIEINPKEPLYIINERNIGYRIEHAVYE